MFNQPSNKNVNYHDSNDYAHGCLVHLNNSGIDLPREWRCDEQYSGIYITTGHISKVVNDLYAIPVNLVMQKMWLRRDTSLENVYSTGTFPFILKVIG